MQAFKSDTIRVPRSIELIRLSFRVLNQVIPAWADDLALHLFLRVRRKRVSYDGYLPKGAQKIEIVHNLRKLNGYKWGNGKSTVLLVHGWESHLGQMLSFVEPLIAQGYTVITFDAPGHGASPSQPTTISDFAYAIEDVIDQYGPIEAVIAHSFGAAATVLSLARSSSSVKKLALLAPMTKLDDHLSIFSRIAAFPADMIARLRSRVASHIGEPVEQFDAAEAARSLNLETLVLHDEADQTIAVEHGRQLAEALNARFMTTSGLGHRGLLRDDAVIDAVGNFLIAEPAAPQLVVSHPAPMEYESLRTA